MNTLLLQLDLLRHVILLEEAIYTPLPIYYVLIAFLLPFLALSVLLARKSNATDLVQKTKKLKFPQPPRL
jgi:hypothetical protein